MHKMKILIISVIILSAIAVVFGFRFFSTTKRVVNIDNIPKAFHELTYTSIDGKAVKMSDYKGKYVLVVNVASKCGYTKQYEPLQKLYEKHQGKLVIVGFPCNQFMGQEPGGEEEIAEFCTKNYGVSFPLSAKIDVKGKDQHPVYTWLTTKALNGKEDHNISWNFNKFLIAPDGSWLGYFDSKAEPLGGEIEAFIK